MSARMRQDPRQPCDPDKLLALSIICLSRPDNRISSLNCTATSTAISTPYSN
ncbi:predicted protein [Histoplasma capsulatum var. duboisii H88]|uniref:Predicted protein n=1 Tax=Ajellomyces capsulatus (strain H88) TaxID=544711 RepID=F0U5Y0_AJEC8|nr:predicted protein [Histoplasma capsulatum var. duboisii H88]